MSKKSRHSSEQPAASIKETQNPSGRTLWILTAIAAVVYYAYSHISNALYMHDEAAHYLNMREFWHDPDIILGNWAKTGYKLFYVIPSLLGPHAVLILNCLVAAFACWLAYRVAEAAGAKQPLFAFAFLALQPFWVELSFRNYAETISGVMLLAALWFHYKNRYLPAAFFLSYLMMIRQEFYPILGLYAVFLLVRKQFIPLVALAAFPLLNSVWGWAATGDPLYILHQMMGWGKKIQDFYPRQGFFHYSLLSNAIFGSLALTFFVLYFTQVLFDKEKPHWPLILAFGIFFLEHSVFNLKSFVIGPSTGGDLRFMVAVAPIMAVMAAFAAERLLKTRSKKNWLIVLVPYALAVMVWMRYKHNNVVLTNEINWIPVVTTLIAVSGIFLIRKAKSLLIFVSVCAVGFAAFALQPMKRSAEDGMMIEVTDWAKKTKIDQKPLLLNHSLFYYYWGKTRFEFPNGAAVISDTSVTEAKPGTLILWDSHYSYRPQLHPEHLNYTYFLEHKDEFRLYRDPFLTPDRRFGLFVFEKTAGSGK